jgi:hypothetical protein
MQHWFHILKEITQIPLVAQLLMLFERGFLPASVLKFGWVQYAVRSNLEDLIQKFQDHSQLPEVVEYCRLCGCHFLWSTLHSVLPNLSPPATHSNDAAVQDAIEFFRAARAAQADKQPVCVSDLITGIIRDSPHCVTLLAAICQGLST